MRFAFSEDQLLLQSTLRAFLAKEFTPARVRSLWETESGRSPELWKQLGEIGVPGLLVPESHEGMGMDEIDFVLLLEETGRAALAEPVISSAAVAVPLLLDCGSPDLQDRWLPPLARGECTIAVGHPQNAFVSDAHVAELLLLAKGDEVHAVGPQDVGLTREPANDPSRRIFSVDWSPGEASLVADGERGRALQAAALDRGALSCAAELVGVTEQLLDMAVHYASQREQFGKPIGSFQALKHMMADVKVKLEYARPLVHRAAHSVARNVPDRPVHVSMAKLAAAGAARRAVRTALQVHGAIGYTWEQDLHIWMRRAWSLEVAWGRDPFHRNRVSESILAEGTRIGPGITFAGED